MTMSSEQVRICEDAVAYIEVISHNKSEETEEIHENP
jgi:hypothetical protein